MSHQRGFLLDLKRCTGCKGCQTACKAENNTRPQPGQPHGASVDYRRVVFSRSGSSTATMTRLFVSTACYHCATPTCRAVCPVGAISKRGSDGVVLIDYAICIGCRRCQFACGYGAPRYSGVLRKMTKCTFCQHLIDAGLTPACVTTCVAKALRMKSDMKNPGEVDYLVNFDALDPEGPPGEPSSGPREWKRDAATYGTVLGTSPTRHANTKPNVGFAQ